MKQNCNYSLFFSAFAEYKPTTATMKQNCNYSLFFSALPAPVPLYFERAGLKL